MKPQQILLSAVLSAPLGVPLLAAIATDNFQTPAADDLLVAALPANERVWVKVRQSVSVEELSLQLNMDETRLARLNEVDEDHQFRRGEWLALPSPTVQRLKPVGSLDTSELRSSPPLEAPPPVNTLASTGVVKLGDTMLRIADRYGLSIHDLLRLNPGLESARLVVGTQVRLAQSSPARNRMLLGLIPSTSGGISWPETPEYEPGTAAPVNPHRGGSQLSFIWPAQGVFTSGYGWRWGRMHKGIDVANNVGTPVVAVQRGRVSFAGWHDGGYGYLVEITHEDGTMTRYAHNSRLLVQDGQEVEQGQVISQMGSTGRSTGPHLHFEIHPPGQGATNPLQFLPERA